jgi:uncharacterized protein (TIGR02284 family)
MALNDDTIDTLNNLIETSKDGEFGFRASAEVMRNTDTRQLLVRRAEECRQAAQELQSLVVSLGGSAEDSGSLSGAAHRGWVAVKGTLTGYTDVAILEEAERGEDSALAAYRSAIEKGLPDSVRSTVERQYEGVKRNHAQMRSLRDQARATSR